MTFKWAFERHLHYLKGMAFQNAALDFTLTHDNQAAESVATLRKFFMTTSPAISAMVVSGWLKLHIHLQ